MLASADQVAIDAVAAKMMGFDPMSHRVHPRRARGRPGRRATRATSRSWATTCRSESWGFQVGDNLASRGGDLLWFGPLKVFQKLLLPHAARQRLRLRLRGVPRLLPLAVPGSPRPSSGGSGKRRGEGSSRSTGSRPVRQPALLGFRLSAFGSRLWALGSRLWALGFGLSALGSGLSALGSRQAEALGPRLWASVAPGTWHPHVAPGTVHSALARST